MDINGYLLEFYNFYLCLLNLSTDFVNHFLQLFNYFYSLILCCWG